MKGGVSMGQYIIKFPEELHKMAKVRAAQEGITLKELIIIAVKDYLKKKRRWFYGHDLQTQDKGQKDGRVQGR